MSQDLRRNVVRAIGSSTMISVLSKVVSLCGTLVMVRLLSPSDFGLVAVAMTIAGVVAFFNEIGLGAAIVQRKEVASDELSGCFGLAVLASTLLCAVVFALSWPMARYYEMPSLQAVLAVLAFSLYFGALDTVPQALLRKAMRFQVVLWASGSTVLVQTAVAIPLAWMGFKHWAIVIGYLAGQSTATVVYWWASGWRPTFPISLAKGRQLMGYGLNVTYSRVMWHLYMNADKLIIGKLLGAHAVGIYDVARSLSNLPTSQIAGVATNIASPVFAGLQHDTASLREALLRLVRGISYLAFPVLLLMAVLAEELILVLVGAKWTDAIWPLRALCIAEIVASIAVLQSQLLISTGNVKRLVHYNTACAVVLPLAIAAGAYWGALPGVALAWALAYPLVSLWLVRESLQIAQLPLRRFLRAVAPAAAWSGLAAVTIVALRPALGDWGSPPVLLLAGAAAGGFVYLACLIYFDRGGLTEVRQVLLDLGIQERKLAIWPFSRLTPRGAKSAG